MRQIIENAMEAGVTIDVTDDAKNIHFGGDLSSAAATKLIAATKADKPKVLAFLTDIRVKTGHTRLYEILRWTGPTVSVLAALDAQRETLPTDAVEWLDRWMDIKGGAAVPMIDEYEDRPAVVRIPLNPPAQNELTDDQKAEARELAKMAAWNAMARAA